MLTWVHCKSTVFERYQLFCKQRKMNSQTQFSCWPNHLAHHRQTSKEWASLNSSTTEKPKTERVSRLSRHVNCTDLQRHIHIFIATEGCYTVLIHCLSLKRFNGIMMKMHSPSSVLPVQILPFVSQNHVILYFFTLQ